MQVSLLVISLKKKKIQFKYILRAQNDLQQIFCTNDQKLYKHSNSACWFGTRTKRKREGSVHQHNPIFCCFFKLFGLILCFELLLNEKVAKVTTDLV